MQLTCLVRRLTAQLPVENIGEIPQTRPPCCFALCCGIGAEQIIRFLAKYENAIDGLKYAEWPASQSIRTLGVTLKNNFLWMRLGNNTISRRFFNLKRNLSRKYAGFTTDN